MHSVADTRAAADATEAGSEAATAPAGGRRQLQGSAYAAGVPAAGEVGRVELAAAVALTRLRFVQPLQAEVLLDLTNVTAWCGTSWRAAEDVALAALEYAHATADAPVQARTASVIPPTACPARRAGAQAAAVLLMPRARLRF